VKSSNWKKMNLCLKILLAQYNIRSIIL
jgi:hypothetical protein